MFRAPKNVTRVELSHSGNSWNVQVYPFADRPHCVAGTFRPTTAVLGETRSVLWPSLGQVPVADARAFADAVEMTTSLVEEMADMCGDGRVLVSVRRQEGNVLATYTAGKCRAEARVGDVVILLQRMGHSGGPVRGFAEHFDAWVESHAQASATYLQSLSDDDLAGIKQPFEV